MPDLTQIVPDPQSLLHTVRLYLQSIGKNDTASLLSNSICTISVHPKMDREPVTLITLYVPVSRLSDFTGHVRNEVFSAIQAVFPPDAGLDLMAFNVSPILESPPDEEKGMINCASLISLGTIEYDGLRFRSHAEIKIYEAFKKRKVLVFVNAAAVLGARDLKREPDFLVCQNGKWGILEVMGEDYHPGATAMKDHDRARLFKDYGVQHFEFYDAGRCYNKPEEVVTDFLRRLSIS